MSWSLNVQGSKTHVRKYLDESKCCTTFPLAEQKQFADIKTLLLQELENIPKNDAAKVEANGSMNVDIGTGEILWSQCKCSIEPIRLIGMSPND